MKSDSIANKLRFVKFIFVLNLNLKTTLQSSDISRINNQDFNFQEYQLDENEERSMIEPKSYENPKLQELIRILLDWINDELHTERIIVQVSNVIKLFSSITEA